MTDPPQQDPARVVWIHPQAPQPPGFGQPCNGCGLCCLTQPCPLGMFIGRTTQGPCSALIWSEGAGAYRCGVLASPSQFVPWLPAGLVRGLARRWISAGSGCDAPLARDDFPA